MLRLVSLFFILLTCSRASATEDPWLDASADLADSVNTAVQQTSPPPAPCPPEPQPVQTSAQTCATWDTAMQPVRPLSLPAADAGVAADTAKTSMHSVSLGRAALETGAACVERRIPNLKDPRHLAAFYRFNDRTLWMQSGLNYLASADKASLQNMVQQYGDLKKLRPDSDAALIAATSFREAGVTAWQASAAVVQAARERGQGGGLNHLSFLPHRYLPAGYGASWKASSWRKGKDNEGRLEIPQKDLPVAYGAWLLFSKDEFEKSALKFGFTQDQLNALSPDARRIWIGVFFAITGGYVYQKDGPNHGLPGGDTVLTHLKSLIDSGKAHGLEDIVSSPDLYNYRIVQLATAVAANAALIEKHLGLQ